MEKLSLEHRKMIEQWFDERVKVIGQCPVCRHRNFSLLDHMVAPPIFETGGGITIGGPAYPMIMIACGNCGHIHFHNAVMLGLLPGSTPPPPIDPGGSNGG
jgi:predicted nucleic-acid-binding Zn-ribbon protein